MYDNLVWWTDLFEDDDESDVRCVERWHNGVPDSVRIAMWNHFPKGQALLVEMVIQAAHKGLLDPDCFSIAGLHNAISEMGHDLATSTLYRFINDMYFFSKLDALDNTKKNNVSKNNSNENKVSKNEKKLKPGRPTDFYCMNSWSDIKTTILHHAKYGLVEMAHRTPQNKLIVPLFTNDMLPAIDVSINSFNAHLEDVYALQEKQHHTAIQRSHRNFYILIASFNDLYSTPLPPDCRITKEKDHRAGWFQAVVRDNPGISRSQTDISSLLGISKGSIPTYLQTAQVRNEQQYKSVRITASTLIDEEWLELQCTMQGGFPYGIEILSQDQSSYIRCHPDKILKQLQKHKQSKAPDTELYLRLQIASKQYPLDVTVSPDDSNDYMLINIPRMGKRSGTYYEAAFNPAWVLKSLHTVFQLREQNHMAEAIAFIDTETGERYPNDIATVVQILTDAITVIPDSDNA